MNAVYVETSAVLRWLFGEKGRDRVAPFFETARRPVSSVLTILEAQRTIARAERQQPAGRAQAPELRQLLILASENWDLLEITGGAPIRSRAGKPFPVEPVRTLDAIHLATSLEFAKVFPVLSLLSFDDRILKGGERIALLSSGGQRARA